MIRRHDLIRVHQQQSEHASRAPSPKLQSLTILPDLERTEDPKVPAGDWRRVPGRACDRRFQRGEVVPHAWRDNLVDAFRVVEVLQELLAEIP